MNAADVTPTEDRLLVRALTREELTKESAGGLWLPPSAEERQRYRQWTVVAVGPYVGDEALLPGARVLITQWSGTPFEFDGEAHAFVREENVSAIFVDEDVG